MLKIKGTPVKYVNEGWKTAIYKGIQLGEFIIWDMENPEYVLDFKDSYMMSKAEVFYDVYKYEIEPILANMRKGDTCEYYYHNIFNLFSDIFILWFIGRSGYQAECLGLSKNNQGTCCIKFIITK